MVDPMTSLAFSVYSSRGVYALLLGSGLSRSAKIPTGWEVTLDLIRQLALSSEEECGAEPAAWYQSKFNRPADYSELLDMLGKTSADRANILAQYFEPSAKDIEEGNKVPTAAHRAIARLIAKGFFRVVITTNFDRLLEQALESAGISPTIISTSDAIKGALPLAHARCTIVKVHGDYRDTRIKNTITELQAYDPDLDRLLDRIFDEYGLIVCGWSASWDSALRNAIKRSPNRRFSCFWPAKGNVSGEAKELIQFRQAAEISINSADEFFGQLETKLEALERYQQAHPLSTQLAIASLKRFISEPRFQIELHDLVMHEVSSRVKSLSELPMSMPGTTYDQLFERMKVYEGASDTLIALLTHGVYWGKQDHVRIWSEAIRRVAGLATMLGGNTHLLSLRLYPALLLLYASGIAAIAAQQYETLRILLRDTFITDSQNRKESPLALSLLPWSVLDYDISKHLPGYEQQSTPINNRIFDILKEPLSNYAPDENRYEDFFGRFEYLLALVHLDLRMLSKDDYGIYAPIGRFGWQGKWTKSAVDKVKEESEKESLNWLPLSAGLFSSNERFQEVQKVFIEKVLRENRF